MIAGNSTCDVLSIGHFYSNSSHCIFDDLTVTGTVPYTNILDTDNRLCQWSWCCAHVMCSLFELMVAQTPNRMRGIMMGLMLAAIGFGST